MPQKTYNTERLVCANIWTLTPGGLLSLLPPPMYSPTHQKAPVLTRHQDKPQKSLAVHFKWILDLQMWCSTADLLRSPLRENGAGRISEVHRVQDETMKKNIKKKSITGFVCMCECCASHWDQRASILKTRHLSPACKRFNCESFSLLAPDRKTKA